MHARNCKHVSEYHSHATGGEIPQKFWSMACVKAHVVQGLKGKCRSALIHRTLWQERTRKNDAFSGRGVVGWGTGVWWHCAGTTWCLRRLRSASRKRWRGGGLALASGDITNRSWQQGCVRCWWSMFRCRPIAWVDLATWQGFQYICRMHTLS